MTSSVDRVSGILVNMSSPHGSSLATNLRRLRLQRGLSTVDLARRAGISRATLAQLETGAGNPTLETLYGLANALDAALAELITEPPAAQPTRVVRAGEGSRVVGDAVEARLLAAVATPACSTEIYDFRLHGNAVQHSQAHPQGTKEHLHVYSGRVRVGPAIDPVEVGAGDFVAFHAHQDHLYQRIGKAAVRGLLVITNSPG